MQRLGLILFGSTVRAAAESASRAGYFTIGVDKFGDIDCRCACDAYFSLDDDACETLRQIEWIAKRRNLAFLTVGGVSSDCHHKLGTRIQSLNGIHALENQFSRASLACMDCLASIAHDADVEFPQSYPYSTAFPPLNDAQKSKKSDQWLIKKRVRTGGFDVHWWHEDDANIFDHDEHFVQHYVAGQRIGATYLSDGKAVALLGACRSLTTRRFGPPFVYAGSFGPVHIKEDLLGAIRRVGKSTIENVSLRGLFNADFIVSDSRITLLEINPRWSGSTELIERDLVQRSVLPHGESLMGLAVAAINNQWSSGARRPGPEASKTTGSQHHQGRVKSELPKANLHEPAAPLQSNAKETSANPIASKNPHFSNAGALERACQPRDQSGWLRKVVFSRRSGTTRLQNLLSATPAAMQLADIPHDGTRVKRNDPLVSLLIDTNSVPIQTHRLQIRDAVRWLQSAVDG